MNILLRKQQKMRENGRNWDKKLNADINKDNSKTTIENFGKFAISDCCFISCLRKRCVSFVAQGLNQVLIKHC